MLTAEAAIVIAARSTFRRRKRWLCARHAPLSNFVDQNSIRGADAPLMELATPSMTTLKNHENVLDTEAQTSRGRCAFSDAVASQNTQDLAPDLNRSETCMLLFSSCLHN